MASLATQSPTDRHPSPLGSNNPFRNRHGPPSPALPSPQARSMNPFLDTTEVALSATATVPTMAPQPVRPQFGENTRELLENLSMDDAPKRRAPPPPPSQPNEATAGAENVPPISRGMASQSQDERRRMVGKPQGPPGELNIFADPSDKSRERRPRRNSDTSVRERTPQLLDPNDDRRRKERRHRDAKRDGKKGPNRRLDVIDKLDVTGIYGGGLFHHDGPFDACNPHRNRKGIRAAPLQAFPKDSRNMQLGGSGPNNSNINLLQFHGQDTESYNDFSSAVVDECDGIKRPTANRSVTFHPVNRDPVHGEESMGLGTSTFLEGAPASKTAIQRRESDFEEVMNTSGGGLGRKKSLAMKIRGISNSRTVSGRITSPGVGDRVMTPTSPTGGSQNGKETNPYFKDYDAEYAKKGAQITFAEDNAGRARAPSSPKRGLERKTTIESIGEEPKTTAGGGGFLSRVKSLKGGSRRARSEKRDAS